MDQSSVDPNNTCNGAAMTWRPPHTMEPYGYPFRTCSYCGGIHPEDALKFIADGCTLERTDKGYKRYLNVPNPIAGKIVKIGSNFDNSPIMRPASDFTSAKVYRYHFNEVQFAKLNLIRGW